MATISQLDMQIGKLQVQRDIILQQVNKIEQQEGAIRKQMMTANDAQKAKLGIQLSVIAQQKAKLTGAPTIQTEDEAVTTTTAGNVSSIGGEGNFPMRWGTDKKSSKMNVMQRVQKTESVYKYVDSLGSCK